MNELSTTPLQVRVTFQSEHLSTALACLDTAIQEMQIAGTLAYKYTASHIGKTRATVFLDESRVNIRALRAWVAAAFTCGLILNGEVEYL